MKQRHNLLSQSRIYMQQNPADANLTIEELRAMVGRMSSVQLMNRLQRYAAKTQGTKQYWYSRYQDLKALLQQKGSPTFFFTVSSADNYWPQLHSLMPHPADGNTTHCIRVNSVINNPHITDWYFQAKLNDFVLHWLQQTLDAEWYWFRYEYQARGSTHAHAYGCVKLRNDAGLCKLVSRAALGWSEERYMEEAHANNDEAASNHHIIEYGNQAKSAAIGYVDWLVATINTAIPDETWRTPDPHPCTQKLSEVDPSSLAADYQALVNCVQRHTRCSPSYCLRKKNSQEPTCRFGYPMECTASTTISFEKISNGEIKATLATQRNDPRINSHNRFMLQHWRANVDMQIIVDVNACARYMTKYIAKSEPRSKAVSDIFSDCVSPSTSSATALRKCMIQSVGERDYSAQETAHLLLSLPLYQCNYNFVTLSLDGGQLITTERNTSGSIVTPSMIDVYSYRNQYCSTFPDIATVNVLQFAATYSLNKTEPTKRTHPVIVKSFPSFSSDPKGPKYAMYCKYQLIKLKPWHNTPSNAWDSQPPCDDVYITAYHDFLQTEYARTNVVDHSADLERAEHYIRTQENSSHDEYEYQTTNHVEEWMLLCQLNPTYEEMQQEDSNVDWEAAANQLPQPLLRSCANWINTMRVQTKAQHVPGNSLL